jgi:hypothetical protein
MPFLLPNFKNTAWRMPIKIHQFRCAENISLNLNTSS